MSGACLVALSTIPTSPMSSYHAPHMVPDVERTPPPLPGDSADPEAWQSALDGHLAIAHSIAVQYMGYGMEVDDLVQEGYLDLLEALTRTRRSRLTDYLSYRIRTHIECTIARQVRTICLPFHVLEAIQERQQIQEELTQHLPRDPTDEEIALYLARQLHLNCRRGGSAG